MTRAEELAVQLDRIGRSGAIKESPRDAQFLIESAGHLRDLTHALRAIASHPTGGVGCNPESFVAIARSAIQSQATRAA